MLNLVLLGAISIMAITFLAFCYRGFARTKNAWKQQAGKSVHPLSQNSSSDPSKRSGRSVNFWLLASVLFAVTAYGQSQSGSTSSNADATSSSTTQSQPPAPGTGAAHASTAAVRPDVQPTVAQEIEALKARIDQLEKEVQEARGTAEEDDPAAALKAATKELVGGNGSAMSQSATPPVTGGPAVTPEAAQSNAPAAATPTTPAPRDPHAPAFSDWDWTWLNGNPRNKDRAFDSKFFTPEIRADVTYNYDFNRPKDNTMSGSSELFRANEIQPEQMGLGGDFHLDNAHARVMTQFGMYSTATVRNDGSYSKGQWDIGDADRYLSEAYAGYSLPNVMHGVNMDAGIFMSYVGLFSYYNFDNWAYQPSFVSSNTPWFFEGIRLQFFPTEHIKIEPWFINGWQSYGTPNSRKGLGGQFKWTPRPWMNIISNNYGLGNDDLGVPGRERVHTDNSIEIKYFDKPDDFVDKMAFSVTADMGCEFGKGVQCHGGTLASPKGPKQSFIGYMFYDRTWFKKDHYGVTIGGGQINDPGRYLVLLPPINGESASSAAINAPYFTGNPGDPFKAWDTTFTFDYMPVQWLTWRWEYGYRHASVPYWNGHGGMTPPAYLGATYGTNNGSPTQFACMDGSTVAPPLGQKIGQVPNNADGFGAPAYVDAYCGSSSSPHGGVWYPDLRRDEQYVDIDLMVKF
jgi:TolA-binding protein